jgi:hypothetical protein
VTNLTIDDLIRSGQFDAAVERMQAACRVYDPTVPVDVDAVQAQYEATKEHLKSVVPPAPFKVVVELVRG